MHNRVPRPWLFLLVLMFSIVIGCASSFQPRAPEKINFQERSQTRVDGGLRVTAAVLSAKETEAVFGFALYKKGIQPIWLEIENKDDKPTWFLRYSVDPDVDETRAFLIQDLWYSQGVESFGYVEGVGAAPYSEPRGNLTGDPYFTDGLRAVFWVSSKPVAFSDVGWIDWEEPSER